MAMNAWKIEIPLDPCASRKGEPTTGKWLSAVNPPRFMNITREKYWSTMYVSDPELALVV